MNLACIPEALSAEERARSSALLRTIREATVETAELDAGWALRVRGDLRLVAEWIGLERRCCPFLDFEVRWARGEETFWLRLTGPDGTKEILKF